MKLQEINQKLKKIAIKETTPFCYTCYQEARTGICTSCHSDDLMRFKKDSGVEYGTDWVVEELVDENLEPIDSEELFSQMIEECYGEETKVGFLTFSTVQVMKDQDPISWEIAKDEYISSLAEDEELITLDNGSNYYWRSSIENYLEEAA